MKVKICGITCSADAAMCEDYGADALGFVHFPGRSRSLPLESISEICSSLGSSTSKVLVCQPASVESSLSMLAASGANILQLYSLDPEELSELHDHGVQVMRVVKPSVSEAERFASVVHALVFEDGTPGTGTSYDFSKIPAKHCGHSYIAGGLTPGNVHLAKALRPFGVDVSSGVETHTGRKDPRKVEDFIRRCRA